MSEREKGECDETRGSRTRERRGREEKRVASVLPTQLATPACLFSFFLSLEFSTGPGFHLFRFHYGTGQDRMGWDGTHSNTI